MVNSTLLAARQFSSSASQPAAQTGLMLQSPDVRPSMTLNDAPIESFEGRWAVALIKSREEKACAEYLAVSGVAFFLPLKIARDRYKRAVWRALFPSYLFFCEQNGEDRFAVLDSGFCLSHDSVKSVLSCAMQSKLKDDLSRIQQQQLAKPEMIDTYKFGAPVKVIRGPWMGREGFIEHDSGKPIVIFRSEIFGHSSVPFEVDRNDVEPL